MDYKICFRVNPRQRANMGKVHKMTYSNSTEFETQKVNVKIYNNILRNIIQPPKNYFEALFNKLKITLKSHGKQSIES